jgi:hypothetical protein
VLNKETFCTERRGYSVNSIRRNAILAPFAGRRRYNLCALGVDSEGGGLLSIRTTAVGDWVSTRSHGLIADSPKRRRLRATPIRGPDAARSAPKRRRLKSALAGLMPKAAVHDLAEGMLALMYGLWLRFALDPPGLDAARAIRITMDIVRARLGVKDGVPSSPSQRSARALGFKAVSRSA